MSGAVLLRAWRGESTAGEALRVGYPYTGLGRP